MRARKTLTIFLLAISFFFLSVPVHALVTTTSVTDLNYSDYGVTVSNSGWYNPDTGTFQKYMDTSDPNGTGFYSTNKIKIKNNSVKLNLTESNDGIVSHVLFWNKNGTYIGYINIHNPYYEAMPTAFSTYETDKYLGTQTFTSNILDLVLPNYAYSFALVGTSALSAPALDEIDFDLTFSDFLTSSIDVSFLEGIYENEDPIDLIGYNDGVPFDDGFPSLTWELIGDAPIAVFNPVGGQVQISYDTGKNFGFNLSSFDYTFEEDHDYYIQFYYEIISGGGGTIIIGNNFETGTKHTEASGDGFITYYKYADGTLNMNVIGGVTIGSFEFILGDFVILDLSEIFGNGNEPNEELIRSYLVNDDLFCFAPITSTELSTIQLITNGDFSDGTAGWNLANATGDVVGGVYSFIASAQYGRIVDNVIGYYIIVNIGDSVYRVANIKTNSNLVGITAGTTAINLHSGSDNYEIISILRIANATNEIAGVSDNRTVGWSQIDVDYVYAFNISTLTTDKTYSDQFNDTFDNMTDANIKSQMDTWIADGLDTIIYGTDSEFYRIRDEWEELKELKEEPFPTMNVPDLDLAYFDETFFDYAYYYYRLIFLEPETQDYLLELYYDSQLGNLRREFFVTDLLCYYMGYGLDEWPYSVDYYNEMAERFSTDYTSLDFATFSDWGEEGSLTFTYDVYPPAPDIDVSIEDFIDNLGLGDFARPLIIAAFIMIIIVLTLIFSGGSAPWFVYIIELVSGILLATIFGWIPVWITLIIGAVLMFAIFFKLKSGGNGGDEG